MSPAMSFDPKHDADPIVAVPTVAEPPMRPNKLARILAAAILASLSSRNVTCSGGTPAFLSC